MSEKLSMHVLSNAPPPVAQYAHARTVELDDKHSLLFLCGMGPRDKTTNQVPGITEDAQGNIVSYDVTLQTRNVLENIDTVIKGSGGRGLGDVIDTKIFLVNPDADTDKFNHTCNEFTDLKGDRRRTFKVSALPLKQIFVELKCIALIRKGSVAPSFANASALISDTTTEIPLRNNRKLLYLYNIHSSDSGNITVQASDTFRKIEAAIKEAGGNGLGNVLDVQAYLSDIPRDFQAFNETWKDFMVVEDVAPTRTTVENSDMPNNTLVQLDCVALI